MKIEKRGTATNIRDYARPEVLNSNKEYAFDFKNAVSIIRRAIENGDKITIMGDYDCDGVCATAMLGKALAQLGVQPSVRLPLRFTEGYGMKPSMVEEVDSGLIITVDNGITAHAAIDAAKEKGLTVLVTDHHLPALNDDGSLNLPNADCIIDPHVEDVLQQPGYTFADYCGAGIALKIAEELLGRDHPAIEKLYPLACLATVADVMPLVEDNRNIYMRGVKAIHDGVMTKGLAKVFEMAKIDVKDVPPGISVAAVITSDTLGFRIAPCANAASRMQDDGAKIALKCFICDAEPLATKTAAALIALNDRRKTLTATETTEIKKILASSNMVCPIVVHLPESGPGIIGLHAGRLCEDYKVPAIVINGHGDECKGSCRAPEGVNIRELLDGCKDLLVNYGGHAGAAGLTIKEENISKFIERITSLCNEKGIAPQDTTTLFYDLAVSSAEIPAVTDFMQRMLPFGEGNPEPVFVVKDFKVEDVKVLGGKHLKLIGENVNAIGFGLAENGVPEGVEVGATIPLVGMLNYNIFKGCATPQISIVHIPTGDELVLDEPSLKGDDEYPEPEFDDDELR